MSTQETIKHVAERCRTLDEALRETFPVVREEGDRIFVDCCGEIRYGSGIMGGDSVHCKGCDKEVMNLLSPHVSPLLQSGRGSVYVPDEEMIELFGARVWMSVEAWNTLAARLVADDA